MRLSRRSVPKKLVMALPQNRTYPEAGVFWLVLVRVTSWIVPFVQKTKDDPRSSHELNTKLVTTEIDF